MAADLDVGTSVLDRLRSLHRDIDFVLAADVSAGSSTELIEELRELERAARRLPAARSARVAELASRGVAAERGCRSDAAFLRQLLNCSAAEAGSRLALADDLVAGPVAVYRRAPARRNCRRSPTRSRQGR